jgi:hypothetical protein
MQQAEIQSLTRLRDVSLGNKGMEDPRFEIHIFPECLFSAWCIGEAAPLQVSTSRARSLHKRHHRAQKLWAVCAARNGASHWASIEASLELGLGADCRLQR